MGTGTNAGREPNLTAITPAVGGAVISLAATDYTPPGGKKIKAIRVGGAGDLSVVTPDGSTIIIPSVLAGELIPLQATSIVKATTTATLITVFW